MRVDYLPSLCREDCIHHFAGTFGNRARGGRSSHPLGVELMLLAISAKGPRVVPGRLATAILQVLCSDHWRCTGDAGHFQLSPSHVGLAVRGNGVNEAANFAKTSSSEEPIRTAARALSDWI